MYIWKLLHFVWYFLHFMYTWRVLHFLWCFWSKAYQTLPLCQNCSTGQSAELGENCQQIPHNFNKTASCSHRCPLKQPAPSLGHWYAGVYLRIFDPGQSNPITFLGLCFPGDYRHPVESPMGFPTFNSTDKAFKFTIYEFILIIKPKGVFILILHSLI